MGQALIVPAVFAAVFFAIVSLPLDARAFAFWPFSERADAAVDFIPSSSTPALVAVRNSNPNAQAASPLPTSGDSALVAYTGPNGSLGDSVVRPVSEQISTYLVQPGDTLSEIATNYHVSVNTIIWANGLKSARDVHPGDTLLILPVSGVEHKVAKGETLGTLAKKYGGDAAEIAVYNGLDAEAPLAVGTAVIVPGGEIAVAPAAKPRTSGTKKIVDEPYRGGSGVNGYFTNPLPGKLVTQGIHGNNGVDMGGHGAAGTPIHAAADGTIITSRSGGWNGGYGNYVVITHSNGTQTLYAHMSSSIVSAGQTVSAGQVIGYVGSTGRSTGAHLHFEIRGAANPFRNCRINTVCAPQ